MTMRWRSYFFNLAKTAAAHSHCERDKVGAIAVNPQRRVIATGYNGVCSGEPDQCELPNGDTKPEVAHAEINLIGQLAQSTETTKGVAVYCTRKPCMSCAVALLAAGVHEIHCLNKGTGEGISHLIKHALVCVYDPETYEQLTLK